MIDFFPKIWYRVCVSIDSLNSLCHTGESYSAKVLRRKANRLSRPVALLVCMLLNTLVTVCGSGTILSWFTLKITLSNTAAHSLTSVLKHI